VPERAKALLVDDRKDNLLALEAILQGLPVTPVAVESGEAALKQLLTDDFAVILLDVSMPGMNGLALQRRLAETGRQTPIIFLSARASEDEERRALQAGAAKFLHKPASKEVLLQAIRAALDGATN